MSKPRLAAIVLAAGRSSRMGRFKPAMEIGGKAMIARVVDEILGSGAVDSILVVTGFEEERVRQLLGGREVDLTHNPKFDQGMFTSIQAGAANLPACDGFFVVLGDQPGVVRETYRAIVEYWRQASAEIVIPTFHGKWGHPVLFAASIKDEILALGPTDTLKTVVERHRPALVEIADEGVVKDVDTPEDFEGERKRLES